MHFITNHLFNNYPSVLCAEGTGWRVCYAKHWIHVIDSRECTQAEPEMQRKKARIEERNLEERRLDEDLDIKKGSHPEEE